MGAFETLRRPVARKARARIDQRHGGRVALFGLAGHLPHRLVDQDRDARGLARLRGALDGRNRTFRPPGGALATLQAVYRTNAQGRQPLQGGVIEGSVVTLAAAPVPGEIIDGDAQMVVPLAANLLPANATRAERALARASVARPLPVDITALWDADRCPTALLPWLAWALSVDEWKAYWPEAATRARGRTAIAIQRRKGTAGSVRDVVAAFGGS
ncbi:hypothetical protein G6F31_016294 [Rhizopus arrhizus]|nr:hypothetical protein G6F31_016294 [Rhizopus arrhizus]